MEADLYQIKKVNWLHNKYLKKRGKLLDAGCGKGGFMVSWRILGYDSEGCDINPSNKNIKKVNLEEKWPYKSNSFDYIFMSHVCEHIKNQRNLIEETHRILRKGGKLIIEVPDWKTYHKHFYDTYTHCTPYTVVLINAIANETEYYKIIRNKIFSNIPFLWRYTDLAFELKMPFKPKAILAILEKK